MAVEQYTYVRVYQIGVLYYSSSYSRYRLIMTTGPPMAALYVDNTIWIRFEHGVLHVHLIPKRHINGVGGRSPERRKTY